MSRTLAAQACHPGQSISGASRTVERAQDRQPSRVSERTEERRLERPSERNMTDDGRFSLDQAKVPHGFVMEFKRHVVMGMEDKRNQVVVRQFHWQPVPHKMQPHFYGHLCKNEDEQVVVDGLGLYMRPEYLNDAAMAETRDDSDRQLQAQLQSLRLASKDQVGSMRTFVKKQTVQVEQPVE